MGTVYSAFEIKIRQDLSDTTTLLSASDLDRHIDHAAADLSLAVPLAKLLSPTSTNGTRTIDLTASLAGLNLVRVLAAEWPVGANPPNWIQWRLFGSTLTSLGPTAFDGTTVNVYARVAMVCGSSSGASTIPGEFDEILARRAGAYAAQELAARLMNQINIGGPAVWEHYLTLSEAILKDSDAQLAALGSRPLWFAGKLHAPQLPPAGWTATNLTPSEEVFP